MTDAIAVKYESVFKLLASNCISFIFLHETCLNLVIMFSKENYNNFIVIISYNPRANGAKRRSGRKPRARVTNSALAEFKVVAHGSKGGGLS